MPGIISAIRVGTNSQPTIEKAITLSKEKDLPLYFLYVVSLDFLSYNVTNQAQAISIVD